MAYSINRTDGSLYATVADGTIDSTTSLSLVGRNFVNYGEVQNENYFRLLENHADVVPPSNPQKGQLWFDSVNSVLNVYSDGSTAKPIAVQATSLTEPASSITGNTWYNTTTNQLTVYNGTDYEVVGPLYTSTEDVSGAIVTTITDTLAADHVVTMIMNATEITAIVSKDPTFTPLPAITGFATIEPGIMLSTTVAGALFTGTASDSVLFNGQAPTDFLSAVADDTTTGTISIQNDGGLSVGLTDQMQLTMFGDTATLANTSLDADLLLSVNTGGIATTAITLDGSTGRANVSAAPVDASNIVNLAAMQLSVADYLPLAGGTMTGPLIMGAVGANVRAPTSGTFSTLSYTFDGDENTGILGDNADGMHLVTAGLPRLTLSSTGKLTAGTASYETLVTADDDIPNKKYVDDLVNNIPTDNPTIVGLTIQSNTGSAWQLVTVNANAKIAFIGFDAFGVFDSGGGFLRVYARKPGLVGNASEKWQIGVTGGSSAGVNNSFASGGGATPVECDALGRVELYCYTTSAGTVAEAADAIFKGWSE